MTGNTSFRCADSAGRLITDLKAQLRNFVAAEIGQERINVINVLLPYPVEHKPVWGIERQSVITQLSLKGRIHILNSVAGNSSCKRARHCCQSERDTVNSLNKTSQRNRIRFFTQTQHIQTNCPLHVSTDTSVYKSGAVLWTIIPCTGDHRTGENDRDDGSYRKSGTRSSSFYTVFRFYPQGLSARPEQDSGRSITNPGRRIQRKIPFGDKFW